MTYQHSNIKAGVQGITLQEVKEGEDAFYKITNAGEMRPFFMSVVSDGNHWMFIASNGGISAGRKDADHALFPYYTDDKIIETAETTGSKTIIRVTANERTHVWEPFSLRSEGWYQCEQHIYKSLYGNKIIFEEVNHSFGLTFRYEWNSSNRFGFVRKATLTNHADHTVVVELLDGIQNILPYGVGSDLQSTTSNLADAYKRSELLPGTGLGIFALSAIIVDKAEPSEALKANVAWSSGLPDPGYLLSSVQLKKFRRGEAVTQEVDVKGEKGAYFVCSSFTLLPKEEKNWLLAANVNQSQPAVIQLAEAIRHNPALIKELQDDIDTGTKNLAAMVAAADGLQYSADEPGNARHFSNTLFNIMRGGIFDNGYAIDKNDLLRYLQKANSTVYAKNEKLWQALPAQFTVFDLKEMARQSGDTDVLRLATEYLPLKFSRRHGDPSRPWNKFTINTTNETDGSKVLDYEGNWRDIFQNWEALALAYPAFIEGMIFKFLNASTFDGYNPYRITKDGFDWETIEPDNPWSYIGYWGDHQVIYLLKFLEFAAGRYPALLPQLVDEKIFVYAGVPYTISSYQQILDNPKDTISFDHEADKLLQKRKATLGADGTLLINRQEEIHKATFTEKILALLLAKLTNLVPGGGIWMNTQRPEWNDANNALVGNGLSMVTLYYLRRFLVFTRSLYAKHTAASYSLSEELAACFTTVAATLKQYAAQQTLTGEQKKQMLDAMGEAAGRYREQVYSHQFTGDTVTITSRDILSFCDASLTLIEQTIRENKRPDGLYHTYNILSYDHTSLSIASLPEMLEGQVAVISSGYLSPAETVQVLDALRNSSLYREDQDSYILYPNKELPSFLQKNILPPQSVDNIPLLQQLLHKNGAGIIEKDILGQCHFNGHFRNAGELQQALQALPAEYRAGVQQDEAALLNLYEQVFNHKSFTGRSGTFFAYEGLGSVYWHMVSKLLLAVQEVHTHAATQQTDMQVTNQLHHHFHAIKKGIGVHKSPAQYGAFPTDPYSHTPLGKGAQQPGMTGQVKEDILSRFGELGIEMNDAQLSFQPSLLRKEEFITTAKEVAIITVAGEKQQLSLPASSLLFTLCQVPVIYVLSDKGAVEVVYNNGTIEKAAQQRLTTTETLQLFHRSGEISYIKVFIREAMLQATQ
ncbi:MAG: hypothetical protein JNM88_11090 [Chitinophagaceae bacterium]|nr:hypothetical protein [Chitinophagaceae bacterium]